MLSFIVLAYLSCSFSNYAQSEECFTDDKGKDTNFPTVVSDDVSFYAKWGQPVKVTVTFDSSGGSNVKGSPFTIDNISLISKPEDPVLNKFKFGGWYKD